MPPKWWADTLMVNVIITAQILKVVALANCNSTVKYIGLNLFDEIFQPRVVRRCIVQIKKRWIKWRENNMLTQNLLAVEFKHEFKASKYNVCRKWQENERKKQCAMKNGLCTAQCLTFSFSLATAKTVGVFWLWCRPSTN